MLQAQLLHDIRLHPGRCRGRQRQKRHCGISAHVVHTMLSVSFAACTLRVQWPTVRCGELQPYRGSLAAGLIFAIITERQ